MKKSTGWALVCVISLIVGIMLAVPSGEIYAAEISTLTMGWSEDPQAGMNPFLARNEGDYMLMSLMYEPLVIPLMTGEITPWLAKSWEYNAAEKTWVFHMDEKAIWSDGVPVTAEDVKFTFDSAFEIDAPTYAPSKAFIESIEVVGEHTVTFKMKQEYAAFLPVAGGYFIMPRHISGQKPAILLSSKIPAR